VKGVVASALAKLIPAVFAFMAMAPVAATERPFSAWDHVLRENPDTIGRLSWHQRVVLQVLSPAEARRWSGGAPAGHVLTLDGRTLEGWLADNELLGPVPAIRWWSVDAGGGVSTDGGLSLSGTIGQPDTSTSSGEFFSVTAGFWSPAAFGPVLFSDDFETGTTHAWSAVSP